MNIKEWAEYVKADAQKMTDSRLMEGIDILDAKSKTARNTKDKKAISLMKQIYYNELQERLWAIE